MIARLRRYIEGNIRAHQAQAALREVLAAPAPALHDFTRSDWSRSLKEPTAFYLDALRYFHNELPDEVRKHRAYFKIARRGFGEDAFHTLWWMLFEKFRPAQFLEIGVYRGQTLTLAALLKRHFGIEGNVVGISPFLPAGDLVSTYRKDVNYLDDTQANFAHFQLPQPELVKAFSTDEAAKSRIAAQAWDLVYIDGNHDYEVALEDWKNCSAASKPGGLIALDDSGLSSSYQPPLFATGGHPGPSRLAREIDRSHFEEILQVGHIRIFQKLPTAS